MLRTSIKKKGRVGQKDPYNLKVVKEAQAQVDCIIKDVGEFEKKEGENAVRVSSVMQRSAEDAEPVVYDANKPGQKYNYRPEYYTMNDKCLGPEEYALAMQRNAERYDNYKSDSCLDDDGVDANDLLKEAMDKMIKQLGNVGIKHAQQTKRQDVPQGSKMTDEAKGTLRKCAAVRIREGTKERTVEDPFFTLKAEKLVQSVKVEKEEQTGGGVRAKGQRKEKAAETAAVQPVKRRQRNSDITYNLVCGACKVPEPAGGGSYRYCIVCKVGIHKFVAENGKVYVQAWPEAVYPHACAGSGNERWCMQDTYEKREFPREEVLGSTFDKLIERFNEWNVEKPIPPGWRIEPKYDGSRKHDEDQRFYVLFPNGVPWYAEVLDAKEVWCSDVMLSLWYMCDTATVDEFTVIGWEATIASSDLKGEKPIPDKTVLPLHGIYGGFPKLPKKMSLKDYQDGTGGEVRRWDQCYHFDIDAVPVDDDAKRKLACRSNVGSMLIALQDKRAIRFANREGTVELEPVEVTNGDEVLCFSANSSHAGYTYGRDELGSLHLALHVEIDSNLLKREMKNVVVDMKSVFNLQPQYVGRFTEDNLVGEFTEGCEKLYKVLESSLESKQGAQEAVLAAAEEHFKVCQEKVNLLKERWRNSDRKRKRSQKVKTPPPGDRWLVKVVKATKNFRQADVAQKEAASYKDVSSQMKWVDLVRSIWSEHGSCWKVELWKRTVVEPHWKLVDIGRSNCEIVVIWDAKKIVTLDSLRQEESEDDDMEKNDNDEGDDDDDDSDYSSAGGGDDRKMPARGSRGTGNKKGKDASGGRRKRSGQVDSK